MDSDLKAAFNDIETINMKRLESVKDQCARQVIIWSTTSPMELERHKDEVKMCMALVNKFGEKFMAEINKENK